MSTTLLPALPAKAPAAAYGQSGPGQANSGSAGNFDEVMQAASGAAPANPPSNDDDGEEAAGMPGRTGGDPLSKQATPSTGKDKTAADNGDDEDSGDSTSQRKHSSQTANGAAAIVMPLATPAGAVGLQDEDGGHVKPAGKSAATAGEAAANGKADATDQPSGKAAQSTKASAQAATSNGSGQSALAALRARLAQADAWGQTTAQDTSSSTTKDASQTKAGSDAAAPAGADQLAKAAAALRDPTEDTGAAPRTGEADGKPTKEEAGPGAGNTKDAKSAGTRQPTDQDHAASSHADKADGTSKTSLSSGTPKMPLSSGMAMPGTGSTSAGASRNLLSVANAVVTRPDWTQAIAAAGRSTTAGGGQTVSSLTLQLNPANLGTVTATLHASGDQLAIHLQVQTAEAYRQLTTGNDTILDKLKGHGYAVEAITVQHVAAGQPPVQQTQHPGFSASQNGSGLARGGQQMAGQGQGRQGNGGQSQVFDPFASPGGSAAASEPGSTRSDGVYI